MSRRFFLLKKQIEWIYCSPPPVFTFMPNQCARCCYSIPFKRRGFPLTSANNAIAKSPPHTHTQPVLLLALYAPWTEQSHPLTMQLLRYAFERLTSNKQVSLNFHFCCCGHGPPEFVQWLYFCAYFCIYMNTICFYLLSSSVSVLTEYPTFPCGTASHVSALTQINDRMDQTREVTRVSYPPLQ